MWMDVILVALIGTAFVFAMRKAFKKSKNGCHGCCGCSCTKRKMK